MRTKKTLKQNFEPICTSKYTPTGVSTNSLRLVNLNVVQAGHQ